MALPPNHDDGASDNPATKSELPESLAETAGDLLGRYKLLEKIGEGGFGVVYVAEQREPVKRRVALKIIKLGMDTRQVVARFEAERQALALMDHPNIAKVLDAGATSTGRPYFVMELVKGIPITQYCDQEKLGTRERLGLFIQVCRAIQHAHQKGIIHRDIKPSNLLVTMHDGVAVPKVIDFGIAKATQQELTDKTIYTRLQHFIGTPAYMSPEQAEMSGLDIDTRSDIYSLGVLLYELLTGRTPFDTKELLASGVDTMRKIIREREPVRPSTRVRQTQQLKIPTSQRAALNAQLSTDLDWVVMKCLEKDRTRRYETANGLALDVQRHLENEPVLARPPSRRYQLQKLIRRHRGSFAAVTCVALALVGGLVLALLGLGEARVERKRADEHAREAHNSAVQAEAAKSEAHQRLSEAKQHLYEVDMLLANQAVNQRNFALAQELLDKHRPVPGERDLRGWEWRYLWGACQGDRPETFATLGGRVSSVAISPDGTKLAAAESLGTRPTVKIWDIESGRLLQTPEPIDGYGAVAFSPDRKLFAFATRSQGLRIWDLARSAVIDSIPESFANDYLGIGQFAPPNGRYLATTARTNVLLWDVQTQQLASWPGHTSAITALCVAPTGKLLASAAEDIRIWSVPDGHEIARITNDVGSVQSLIFTSEDKMLISGSWGGTIGRLVLSNNRLLPPLTSQQGCVSVFALSPDGRTLASGGLDATIILWDPASWQKLDTLTGSHDEVWALAFAPDGKTLFSAAKDGVISKWISLPKVRSPERLRRPDGTKRWGLHDGIIFAEYTNGILAYWDAASLGPIGQYRLPEEYLTNSVTDYPAAGGVLAWATRQGDLVVWNLPQNRPLRRYRWLPGDRKHLTISPDQRWLAATDDQGKQLAVWDMVGREPRTTLEKSSHAVDYLAFSGDALWIAAGNFNGTVELWDLENRLVVTNWVAHHEAVNGVAFLSGKNLMATTSSDGTAALWDTAHYRLVGPFSRTANAFFSVAVTPDGSRIAGGCANDSINLWDSHTRQQLASLKADGRVDALQFLPPDANVLISLTDKEARLWRAPSWGEIEK